MKQELLDRVYKLVQMIPKGKVTTYGSIGKKLKMSPRVVGYTLHLNPDSAKTPCHRVVDRTGRVAPGFAFGGPRIQKKLLEKEGIKFIDEIHVDINNVLFSYD
ncbi:MAG: cysteine methyltransferase [Candidatus Levybacteria bacterium CG_4_10_14_0_2_um_filter_36_16]|nr:MAG: cysteine methyltransferase [Candidatus Levybacteria bacterium CG_4_10_14_0_2_um_filter_36_16]